MKSVCVSHPCISSFNLQRTVIRGGHLSALAVADVGRCA